MALFSKLLAGNPLKPIEKIVDRVEALEDKMKSFTDEQLNGQTAAFRARLAAGETLDDLLPEAFASVRTSGAKDQGAPGTTPVGVTRIVVLGEPTRVFDLSLLDIAHRLLGAERIN